MRYDPTINIKTRWDGKRYFGTKLYPPIPVSPTDFYVVTNDTDSLDNLAFKYYKNPTLWWVLAQANNIGKGRMSVPAGIQLRVPSNVTAILNTYNRLNS